MKLDEKACPRCAEPIKQDAAVCKHCGAEFSSEEMAAAKAKKKADNRNSAIGCLGLLVAGALVATMIGGDDETPIDNGVGSSAEIAQATRDEAVATATPKLSPQAEEVLIVLRQTMMPVLFCTGELDELQRGIEKASAGTGTPMQAYSAGHTAERDCRKMTVEVAEYNRRPFDSSAYNAIYEKTLPACQDTFRLGVQAASIAKTALDEDGSMETAQRYRDARASITGKLVECKLGLQGIADKAGIAAGHVNFLKL